MERLATPEVTWPELPWQDWEATISTLHLWTQIVGKVRLALAPPLNHWWQVTLYASARGMTTSPMPYGRRSFQVDFDFIAHRLVVSDSEGGTFQMALEPKSVASFYREFMAGLRGLGIEVRISPKPVELVEAIPFEQDEQHATYEPAHAHWGSFDLSTSRYSGRLAPLHRGGVPNVGDWVMREAYSHEEITVGWWPRSEAPGPSFFAYTYPEPEGYRSGQVRPPAAFFDEQFGEFILPYDAVRGSADPDASARELFESAYALGADLAGWDRAALEPTALPGRPPRQAWTVQEEGAGGRTS